MAKKRTQTFAIRLEVEDGGKVKAAFIDVGKSGEASFKKIEKGGKEASRGLSSLTDRAKTLGKNLKLLGAAAAAAAAIGGLALLTKNAIEAADSVAKTADKLGVGVEALQELRFAASLAGVEQRTFDMGLQRFIRRVGEAAKGTGEAKAALEQMGIALKDNNGNIRAAEDLLADVADALAGTEDAAERLRLAFKLFDSEGVALVNVLKEGSAGLEKTRQHARDLGIVLEEDLIRNAENAKDQLDTLSMVISANLNRALLGLAPIVADASSAFAELAADAGIFYEKTRLFLSGDFKLQGLSLRGINQDISDLEKRLESLNARLNELLAFGSEGGFLSNIRTSFGLDILEKKKQIAQVEEELRRLRKTLEGQDGEKSVSADKGSTPAQIEADLRRVADQQRQLVNLKKSLDQQIFDITHQGVQRIEAEHKRLIEQIEALKNEVNEDEIGNLLEAALQVKNLRLAELTKQQAEADKKAAESAEKRAAAEELKKQRIEETNQKIIESLNSEIAALSKSERANFIDQAVRRLSAEATKEQRLEVERLAGALFDEKKALEEKRKEEEKRRALIEDIKRLTEEQTGAQEKYNEELEKLNKLLKEGAINQKEFEAASRRARNRMLEDSRNWAAGLERALRSYADEATNAAAQVEEITLKTLNNLEDALVEFTLTGKFEWRDMVDTMIADITRLIIRTQITGPLAGALANIIPSIFGSAMGNAFNSGVPVQAFARGTVVSQPTVFPLANGIGLMGEAGPEAILPLRRLPSGKLGVEATGVSNPLFMVNVDARGAADPNATAAQVENAIDRALSRRIPGIIRASSSAAKAEIIDNFQRRGGRFD